MPIDIREPSPHISLQPLSVLRWLIIFAQAIVVLGADALFEIVVPVTPLLILISSSIVVSVLSMKLHQTQKISEQIARWYLLFDILQLSAFLYFIGGIDNPFSILLLAPLAMAASVLSIYNLCLLLMVAISCVSINTIWAQPLHWHEPAPILSTQYRHGLWVALMITSSVVGFIIWRIATETRQTHRALAQTRAILDEKRRLTSLGALAAAAVHELGSPLGTISVIAKEMRADIHPDDPLFDDIALLLSESQKCKDILADLALDPAKKMKEAQSILRFDRLLMEIAHIYDSTKTIDIHCRVPENLPLVTKTPDLEFGLGNFISNALSFAKLAVNIHIEADADTVTLTIRDDGPGFDLSTLKAIGDPYISTRHTSEGHMGLGIFIARNLLEGTGATLEFTNGPMDGAVISIIWPRKRLETPKIDG